MNKIIFVIFLNITLFGSNISDYEKFLNENNKAYIKYKSDLNSKFKQYKKTLDKEFKQYKKELSRYWENPEVSTSKKWIEYSKDQRSKKSVDFDKGIISIEVISPNLKDAYKKISKDFAKTTIKNTAQAHKDDVVAQRVKQRIKLAQSKINPKPIISDLIYAKKPTVKEVVKYTKKHVTKQAIKEKKSKSLLYKS